MATKNTTGRKTTREPETVETYIERVIDSFFFDLPDTDYQRGYLAAMVDTYRDSMHRNDGRLTAARELVAKGKGEPGRKRRRGRWAANKQEGVEPS